MQPKRSTNSAQKCILHSHYTHTHHAKSVYYANTSNKHHHNEKLTTTTAVCCLSIENIVWPNTAPQPPPTYVALGQEVNTKPCWQIKSVLKTIFNLNRKWICILYERVHKICLLCTVCTQLQHYITLIVEMVKWWNPTNTTKRHSNKLNQENHMARMNGFNSKNCHTTVQFCVLRPLLSIPSLVLCSCSALCCSFYQFHVLHILTCGFFNRIATPTK